ncbi:MAG: hypothetical protein IT371_01690 [Deltaproteobacteria bacterium]|nr:hypothetical protein [Deltaproteobacteria bacterium]
MSTKPLLLLAGLLGACTLPVEDLPGRSVTSASDATDERYTTGRSVTARRYLLDTTLEVSGIGGFARLTGPQKEQLARLGARQVATTEVLALGERMLVRLPEDHPAGPLELLLADDADDLTVFAPGNVTQTLSRERLPDLLDGSEASARSELQLEPPAEEQADAFPARAALSTPIRVDLPLKYRPPGRHAGSWSVRLALRLEGRDAAGRGPTPSAAPLLHLALPLLQDFEGLPVLDTLAQGVGEPLGWQLTVENATARPGRAPTYRTRVREASWVKVPLRRFSRERPGYETAMRPLKPRRAGMQRLRGKELSPLRAGAPGGPLRVRNLSPFAAWLYLDGLRLGWVAPESDFSFAEVPAGYYRLYAVTSTGVRAWGPVDLYVPGGWTLR